MRRWSLKVNASLRLSRIVLDITEGGDVGDSRGPFLCLPPCRDEPASNMCWTNCHRSSCTKMCLVQPITQIGFAHMYTHQPLLLLALLLNSPLIRPLILS